MKRTLCSVVLLLSLFVGSAQAAPLRYQSYTWNVFSKVGNLGQHWSPTHVSVVNGVLTEAIHDGVSGGIGMHHFQTYGTYHVRFRMSRGGGKYAILLFGHERHNEIDFAEDTLTDPNRTMVTGTLHYGNSNNQIHVRTYADMTRWHTMQLRWRPGKLTFLLDGRMWAVITQHVPHTEMHMTIQTFAAHQAKADSRLQVSNVHIAP